MSFYQEKWWKEAIGYQIYLKSFKDSNNDGIGDLGGVIEKLDYLKQLGITLIWLTPFYLSPMDDHGYDVADHLKIDPTFGTIKDFKELIKQAHKRGIKVIIDLILNHTSDEHIWFIEAKKSKDNKYRNYYIWADGKIVDNKLVEPTNWASFFGGSCWNYSKETNQYYMKIFSNKMPDLNWENKEVRKSMQEVAKFWLNLGVDGFRVDAASHLGRLKKLTDSKLKSTDLYQKDWRKFSNLRPTYKYLKEFKEDVFNNSILTIGEVGGGATPKEALKYASFKKGSLSMVFNFDHIFCNNTYEIKSLDELLKLDLKRLKQAFNNWQTKLYKKSWQPLYWLNHDHPRLINQYGDLNNHYLSATMLATALYLMQGTPFIYQGEEIGMTNYEFKKINEFKDVSTLTNYKLQKSKENFDEKLFVYLNSIFTRDNARTMMSWDSSPYAGFSTVKPWFHVNQNYQQINVNKQLSEENSILKYYKQIINLRKNPKYKNTLVYGSYKQTLKAHPFVYSYLRKGDKQILTIVNFFNKDVKIELNKYKVIKQLISNYKDTSNNLTKLKLRKYEAVSYLVEEV